MCFGKWPVLLIHALNDVVICCSAEPCLFVKWANLPQPFREATTKNSKQWQSARNCDWLGLGIYAPGVFQPYLKTLHHLLFSRSYWYVIFSFIHVQIQNDRCRRAKRNKRTQFVIFFLPPSFTPNRHTHFCECFFYIFIYFLSFSIFAMIFFFVEAEVRYIVCDVSMQFGCHQPPMSTF